MEPREKYVNIFTDFGFKKLFGEKPSKPLLLDFLNELLIEQEGPIKNITYLNTEHLGSSAIDRKAIFDIYCENEQGEKFIVELQKNLTKIVTFCRNKENESFLFRSIKPALISKS
jgi:hypothetical protein